MKLSEVEKLLIISVLHHRDRLAAMFPLIWTRGTDRVEYARDRVEIERAHVGIVGVDWAGWLGHFPDARERKAGSRAIHRLIADGLLIGHKSGYGDTQIKYLALTATGEQLAKELTSASEVSA